MQARSPADDEEFTTAVIGDGLITPMEHEENMAYYDGLHNVQVVKNETIKMLFMFLQSFLF